MASIQIQTVLYNANTQLLKTFIESISNNIKFMSDSNSCQLVIGVNDDNVLLHQKYKRIVNSFSKIVNIKIHFFSQNLGHGAAHNMLLEMSPESDFLWVVNPDGMADISCLKNLVDEFSVSSRIAATEARQIPFDHPKIFDEKTLETPWVSGACVLFRTSAFLEVGGFDELFFMHGDDVDISWRLRALGWKLHFVPNARFLHVKEIGPNGHPLGSSSENYYGPLGAVLIAKKYGLKRGLREMQKELHNSGNLNHKLILAYLHSMPLISFRLSIETARRYRKIRKYYSPWRFSKNRF